MRLAVVALSTVLLAGCSWSGSGGGYGDSYSYGQSGAYGCAPMGGAMAGSAHYGNSAYGFTGGGAGCAPGAGYSVANAGGMYGAGAGVGGLRGAHGVNGYGTGLQGGGAGMYGADTGMYGTGAGMYGAGTGAYGTGAGMYGMSGGTGLGTGLGGVGTGLGGVGTGIVGLGSGVVGLNGINGGGITTLGSGASYGSALGGVQTLANGATVQTVTGQPVYVAQPYPAYYSAGSYGGGYSYAGGGGFGGGALPFGLELGAGQDFAIGGDIFPGDSAKTDPISLLSTSDLDAVGYDDAFGNAKGADLTATYDVNYNTTLLGRVGYTKADGNLLQVGTVTDGTVTEDFFVEYSDLEQYTVEGGFRKYMGAPTGMRPYIGATAGFVKTEDVTVSQSSETLVDPTVFTQTYVDGGWSPTASGIVGAEWAVGPRSAIGVETGIRWTDALDTNFVSDDRISVPVRLRGRLSF